MNYQAYLNLTREELLERVAAAMSEKRFKHVLGVEKAALDLAGRYGCDKTKASLAALLHDYAKEVEDNVFLDLIDRYELDPDLKRWGNNIWHGVVGVYKITEDFGITDSEILQAITRHTVGASEMTLLDQVLYVADYIEEGRNFPGVDEARQLSRESIEVAVAYETARTLAHLAEKALPIHPQTLETYNATYQYLRKK